MEKCKGENCKKHELGVHSVECMFEHFMCYTGGYNESENIQQKLKKAYFDGYDAANNIQGKYAITTAV